jgi:hypothetical protein
VEMKYSSTVRPSMKLALIGRSMISPFGLAMSPRMPANWRICLNEPRGVLQQIKRDEAVVGGRLRVIKDRAQGFQVGGAEQVGNIVEGPNGEFTQRVGRDAQDRLALDGDGADALDRQSTPGGGVGGQREHRGIEKVGWPLSVHDWVLYWGERRRKASRLTTWPGSGSFSAAGSAGASGVGGGSSAAGASAAWKRRP